MRVVIPTNDNNGLLAKMEAHFGKANFYTIMSPIKTTKKSNFYIPKW